MKAIENPLVVALLFLKHVSMYFSLLLHHSLKAIVSMPQLIDPELRRSCDAKAVSGIAPTMKHHTQGKASSAGSRRWH